MALSKRSIIKRSKSYFHRRYIKINISIVDLSALIELPTRGPVEYVDVKGVIHAPIEPRGPGISKLFEGFL